ncbi:MAG: polysaccharide biosynthesis protein [Clostridia bacterium]|nr:polysaccharide biosynthesis protein [Clostridia bacterium]MCI2000230.1 polysaccharide biosynthesis protein [Clostridia bacterium]MCI2014605.1 polysaccharide biosynthesis protein [Clostridia bacterium]
MFKKSFTTGCIILMSANMITRLLGFFYRIYMSRAIGTEGMGLYQLIMPIYMLGYSLTSSGITTTVSRLTAQECAKGSSQNAVKILHTALFMCLTLSCALTLALFFGAGNVSLYIIKDARTCMPLKLLSLCFPFMACGSCIRGYFLGKQEHIFPASSQIFEQTVRMISIAAIMTFFAPKGIEKSCVAAVMGIALGETFSFLLTIFFYCFADKKSRRKSYISYSSAFLAVTAMALPLTASRAIGSAISAVENILIPLRLSFFGGCNNALSEYGALTGMIMPLIQFPASLIGAVSVSLIPALTSAQTLKNTISAHRTVTKTIAFTAIVACGASVFFCMFSTQVCQTVYGKPELSKLLKALSILCPAMYLHITLVGILNSLGKQIHIFITGLISSAVNIFFIYFLMPKYGLWAYIYGCFAGQCVALLISIIIVQNTFNITAVALKYFFFSFICSISAAIITNYVQRYLNINTYLSAVLMGALYLCLLIKTDTLDISMFINSKGLRIRNKNKNSIHI